VVSILFPVMLVVLVGIRKLLDFIFTKHELKVGLLSQNKRLFFLGSRYLENLPKLLTIHSKTKETH
jgi:hypothetical protein